MERGGMLCANVDGFDLHGRIAFGAAQRDRLQELVRYCGRPPLANDRLEKRADGYLLRFIRFRMRIEEIFGWIKTTANFRRSRWRGIAKTQLAAYMVGAAYNLMRMAKLQAS